MNVKLLGAHNTETTSTRLSGILIDGVLALDAGSITSSLSLEEQKKIKAVFLTHQHYDHIRDLPALAINMFEAGTTIDFYAALPVFEIITSHLFDDIIYPDYLKRPLENPTVKLNILESFKQVVVEGYSILPVPVSHSVPGTGYQVTSSDGKAIFYTGDTGPGLGDCWRQVNPRLLIIEVTASNRFEHYNRENKHLTPELLRQELITFRELKGYLPQIISVHMSPEFEEEIRTELAVVAGELNTLIETGYEGMEINF